MGDIRFSKKINNLVQDIHKEFGSVEFMWSINDSTCTTGYDNDGSTGYEIFENGFDLGQSAGSEEVWCIPADDLDLGEGRTAWFFIGTEDQVIERIKREVQRIKEEQNGN